MASQRTEIARLVAVITAQNDQAMKAMAEMSMELDRLKKKFGQAGGEATEHFSKTQMSLRDTRHALHLMAATEFIPHQGVQQLMMAVYAFHLLEKSVHGLIASLLTLRGAMMATGIGVIIVLIGTLLHLLNSVKEEWDKVQQSATEAFKEWLSGTKSMKDALEDVNTKEMNRGLEEIAKNVMTLNEVSSGVTWEHFGLLLMTGPAGWARGLKTHFKGMSETVGDWVSDLEEKAKRAERALAQLMTLPQIEFNKLKNDFKTVHKMNEDRMHDAQMEARMIGMTAAEKKIFRQVDEAMNKTGLTERQIREEMKESIWAQHDAQVKLNLAQAKSQDEQRVAGLYDQADALQDQADRMAKSDDEAARMAIVQKYARDRVIPLSQAFRELSGVLEVMETAQQDIADTMLEKKMREWGEATAEAITKVAVSADEAELLAVAFQHQKQHGGDVVEIMNKLRDSFQAMKDTQAIAKIFEDTMTPFEKFQKRMTELNRLFDNGKKFPELYARGVREAEKALAGAANAGERFQAAGFFSAEAQTRLEEFHDRMASPVPLGMAVRGAAPGAFGAEGLDQTNKIMGDVRDILKDRLKPPALSPANLGTGFVPASGGGFGY
jgi:hypothetical protein